LTTIINFNAPCNGIIPELWINDFNNLGALDCQGFILNRMVQDAYCQKLDIVNFPIVYTNTMATYTEANLSGLTNLRMVNLTVLGNNGFYYYNLPSLKYLNVTLSNVTNHITLFWVSSLEQLDFKSKSVEITMNGFSISEVGKSTKKVYYNRS